MLSFFIKPAREGPRGNDKQIQGLQVFFDKVVKALSKILTSMRKPR